MTPPPSSSLLLTVLSDLRGHHLPLAMVDSGFLSFMDLEKHLYLELLFSSPLHFGHRAICLAWE